MRRRRGILVRVRRHLCATGVIAVLALAAGCRSGVKTRSFAVYVNPRANADSPVPVEMVAVYDRKMLAEVAGLTARDWFTRREQFGRDYPDGFRSVRWEFVPGQSIALRPLGLSRRHARALFVWADYLGEGPHRVRIDRFDRVVVEFGETDVTARRAR